MEVFIGLILSLVIVFGGYLMSKKFTKDKYDFKFAGKLKNLGVYKEFVEEWEKSWNKGGRRDYSELNKESFLKDKLNSQRTFDAFMRDAFSWYETEKGFKYWREISKK